MSKPGEFDQQFLGYGVWQQGHRMGVERCTQELLDTQALQEFLERIACGQEEAFPLNTQFTIVAYTLKSSSIGCGYYSLQCHPDTKIELIIHQELGNIAGIVQGAWDTAILEKKE